MWLREFGLRPPGRAGVRAFENGGLANIFYFLQNAPKMHSLPLTTRELKATESRLQSIYDAAKLGLKGDTLALAAGMLPVEYRRLKEMDPVAEMAELKGRADGERIASAQLHKAAAEGDAKAALEILKPAHGWVAKQQVQIDVAQQISITAALEQAQRRVNDVVDLEDQSHARTALLGGARTSVNDPVVVTGAGQRS